MRLQGKTAIVTGAASGIGLQIAHSLAREGARVAIADLDADGAARAAAEIAGGGAEAIGVAMDVTGEDAVERGVAEVVARWGTVDVLVSNAGIQIVHPIEDFPFADWKKMLAIHLDGAFLVTRACLRQMIAAGRGGSIVYTGSVHSKEASVLKSAYVTAKHGLLGLMRTVAKEGAPHQVRANLVAPGFVRTPLVARQIPEQARALGIGEDEVVRKVMLKDTIDGEFTTVEEVAEAVLFLAAFPTLALSGQSLVVSHGWCMA